MRHPFILSLIFFVSCSPSAINDDKGRRERDSLQLVEMVHVREAAMTGKDLPTIVYQFDSQATFINGGGFYYEGIAEIKAFHQSMFDNDSLTYTFLTGKPEVNTILPNVAIVYYPWQQQWTMKHQQSDTLHEVGLMTIIAVKEKERWKWRSMTNQRTKEFFPDLRRHKALR